MRFVSTEACFGQYFNNICAHASVCTCGTLFLWPQFFFSLSSSLLWVAHRLLVWQTWTQWLQHREEWVHGWSKFDKFINIVVLTQYIQSTNN